MSLVRRLEFVIACYLRRHLAAECCTKLVNTVTATIHRSQTCVHQGRPGEYATPLPHTYLRQGALPLILIKHIKFLPSLTSDY